MTKIKKIVKKVKSVKKPAVAKKAAVKKVIKVVARKTTAKKQVNKIVISEPKEKLAEVASLVTHQEWLGSEVAPEVKQTEQLPIEEPAIVPTPVLTTPAYSHMFHSVAVKETPKIREIVIPAMVSFREKLMILAGVAVFALMIGGMWLKITVGYFQTHKFTDGDVVSAANIIGEGVQQIKDTKEQLIHNAAAAVETVQTKQTAIDEANKVLGTEVQKLLDQKNNNQVQN